MSGVISLGRTRKSTDSSSKEKGKACGRTKNVEITHWNQRKRIAKCAEETDYGGTLGETQSELRKDDDTYERAKQRGIVKRARNATNK